jgi:tetratricopeptide (TPR) repeat protein
VVGGRAAGERGLATDAAVALSHLRLLTAPHISAEEVLRELQDAIDIFSEVGDEAGLARALGLAGTLRYWQGDVEAARADLERSARYARDVSDLAQEAHSLGYALAAILWGLTPVEEGLERVEELRSRAEGNRRLEVSVLGTRGQLEAMQGRFDVARELIAQRTALARELGLLLLVAHGRLAAHVELLAGDATAAERALRPGYEALERMGNWGHLASIAPRLADVLFVQGRDEEALPLTELTERISKPWDADPQIAWRRVRAKLLARRGDVENADRLAHEAIAIAERTDLLDDRAQAFADRAEVLRLARRPGESTGAVEESIRLFEQKGNIAAVRTLRSLLAKPPLEV